MNDRKFNPGFTSNFNIGYLDVNQNLRAGNHMAFVSIGFYKVFRSKKVFNGSFYTIGVCPEEMPPSSFIRRSVKNF